MVCKWNCAAKRNESFPQSDFNCLQFQCSFCQWSKLVNVIEIKPLRMQVCLYRSMCSVIMTIDDSWCLSYEMRNVNHIERGLWVRVQFVTPKAPNKNPLLMDAIQTKQIMRQTLFIRASVTQKHYKRICLLFAFTNTLFFKGN